MFCPKCGKELKDGDSFCSYCGENLKEVTKKKHFDLKKIPIKWIAILIAILIFIILLIVIVQNGSAGIKIKKDEYGQEYFEKQNERFYNQQVNYKQDTYYTDDRGYICKDVWIGDNFYDVEGKMLKNDWWLDESTGEYYYLDENGNCVSNCVIPIGNETYAFDETGKLYKNMFFISPVNKQKFMYANENGEVQKGNKFLIINGMVYYVDEDGFLKQNEWVEDGDNWYYFNDMYVPVMNSWIDMTYYVGPDGKMLKNTKSPEGYEIDEEGKVLDKYKIFLLGNATDQDIYNRGYSIIEGTVTALTGASNLSFIKDANVSFYDTSGEHVGTTITDAQGKYRYYLPEGRYKLIISAEGYENIETTQDMSSASTKYAELAQMFVKQSGVGVANGKLLNALDGQPVSGAILRLRNGWNIKSGDYVSGVQITTDSNGNWNFSNVPVGYYTVEAKKSGFVDEYFNIAILNQNPITNYSFSTNPVMPDDGYVRIVLSWGSSPRDLDSHLIGRKPNGNYFDVYYADKTYTYNNIAMANLDVDDTTSYGPETETITSPINGVYVYGVHDYTNGSSTNSNQLSYSDCKVSVYVGESLIARYNVPTGRVGTFWEVFRIDSNNQITPINKLYNYNPTQKDYSSFNILAATNSIYSSVESSSANNTNNSSVTTNINNNSITSDSNESTSNSYGSFRIGSSELIESSYEYGDENIASIKIRKPIVAGGDPNERLIINECIGNAVEDLLGEVENMIDNSSNSPKSVSFSVQNIYSETSTHIKLKFSGVMKYKDSSISDRNIVYEFDYTRGEEDYSLTLDYA